ncbi:MAG TPA: DUF6515 family protein [Flavisolibacter sp.]|jgi:hypothetical protein|nr:DUF6515 family protein [Flavisolibacter sp.]
MNTYVKSSFLLLALVTGAAVLPARAQRHDNGGDRGRSGNTGIRNMGQDRQRNYGQASGNRSADYRNRSSSVYGANGNSSVRDTRIGSVSDRVRPDQNTTFRRTDNVNTVTNRNVVNNNRQVNRNITINNNIQRNYSSTNYSIYNRPGSYRSGYTVARYNYAPRRYVYVGAPRYRVIPNNYISIRFGGYPYYYNGGCFYSYFDNYYQPVYAPVGIRVRILPVGFININIGSHPYYYYEGVYYRRYLDRNDEYEVVDAPLGASVARLPKGATTAVVNGEKFYEFNGTYYKEGTNERNEVLYTVVGKYGEVNNTDQQPVTQTVVPQIGDEFNQLPVNSKEVIINNESLYLSPDNFYYKAIQNNTTTTYKVVGKGASN